MERPLAPLPFLPDPLPTKINIGCGWDKRSDYLNVDVDPASEPDLLVIDHNLSILPDNHFEEVLAWDVLEHVPHAYTMHALLDWNALLRMGGKLVLQTSSVFGVIDNMRSGATFETHFNWLRCLFGNQAHPGDIHFNGFTEKTLGVMLAAAGFKASEMTIADDWLFGCEAMKTSSWTDLLALGDEAMFARAYETYLRRPIEDSAQVSYSESIRTGAPRRTLLRNIVGAPEHLYKLGASMDAAS